MDGWMAMPGGLTPAIRLCCSPGLHLFSCFVSSVSKHFRWIAQLFKKSLQFSITLILLFLQKKGPSHPFGSGLVSLPREFQASGIQIHFYFTRLSCRRAPVAAGFLITSVEQPLICLDVSNTFAGCTRQQVTGA